MLEKPRLSKKKIVLIVIGIILLILVGVIIYLRTSSAKTTEQMHAEIKEETVEVKSDFVSDNLNYDISFYSKDSTIADYIVVNVDSNDDVLNEKQLKIAVEASKLINGLNLEYTNNDGVLQVKAFIQRNKINQDMIDLAMQLQIIEDEQKGLLETISQGNLESIKQALIDAGYKVGE